MCAELFRHTQAGLIAHGDHDLHAYQSQMLKGKARHEFRSASCNTLPVTGSPYPVAQIAEVINRVNAAQRARAKKVIPAQDRKGIEGMLLPARPRDRDVFPGGSLAILIRCP